MDPSSTIDDRPGTLHILTLPLTIKEGVGGASQFNSTVCQFDHSLVDLTTATAYSWFDYNSKLIWPLPIVDLTKSSSTQAIGHEISEFWCTLFTCLWLMNINLAFVCECVCKRERERNCIQVNINQFSAYS